jgi:hypothetical protein
VANSEQHPESFKEWSKEYWPTVLEGAGAVTEAVGAFVSVGAAAVASPITAAVAGAVELYRANDPYRNHDTARHLLMKAHQNPDAHLTPDGSPWIGPNSTPAAATAGHPEQGAGAAAGGHVGATSQPNSTAHGGQTQHHLPPADHRGAGPAIPIRPPMAGTRNTIQGKRINTAQARPQRATPVGPAMPTHSMAGRRNPIRGLRIITALARQ